MSGANFNQILDELVQQKLQVEQRISEATAKIAQYTAAIETLQAETADLQTQLDGLTQLENRTNLLKGNAIQPMSIG